MGLLIAGKLVSVPGVNVIPPASHGGPVWCALSAGDYQLRRKRVRQVMAHSTKGDDPQHVIPGKGPGGRAKSTFEFWQRDPVHSAAHIVIDNNGDVACGADLSTICAYHATVSNEYAVGIELYQESDNGIYEAVFDAMVKLAPFLCEALDIPDQIVADPYSGHSIPRFLDGAPDWYGICSHRDNTEQRGRGDPGDEIINRLIASGIEPALAGSRQDITRGKARQTYLNARGGHLDVDGIAGPASLAEARRRGYTRWSTVPVQ